MSGLNWMISGFDQQLRRARVDHRTSVSWPLAGQTIKQHLRIKAFYVTSPNAVRTQVTASLNYVLKRHTAIKKASLRTPFVF